MSKHSANTHIFAGVVVAVASLQNAAKAACVGAQVRAQKELAREARLDDRRFIRRSTRTAWLSLKVTPEFRREVAAGADREGVYLVEFIEKAVKFYLSSGKSRGSQNGSCATVRPRPPACASWGIRQQCRMRIAR